MSIKSLELVSYTNSLIIERIVKYKKRDFFSSLLPKKQTNNPQSIYHLICPFTLPISESNRLSLLSTQDSKIVGSRKMDITDLDISSIKFNDNRYEYYNYFLKNEPVYWYEPMKSWLVFRFEDIQKELKSGNLTTNNLISEKISNSDGKIGNSTSSTLDIVKTWMIYNDGDTHSRLRRFMNKAFAKEHVNNVMPRIKSIIKKRLDESLLGSDNKTIDIINVFAHPVPAKILKDMLGLDEIPLSSFLKWSDSIALFMQDFVVSPCPNNEVAEETYRDLQDMVDAFKKSFLIRKEQPKQDLLSSLVNALGDDDSNISEDELCYQLIHLIFGGHKIPQFVIGNAMNILFNNVDLIEKFKKGELPLRSFVNEVMRYEGPIQYITRHASSDFVLRDKKIKKGDSVFLMLGAANRDASVFKDPNTFLPEEKRKPSLAFGSGAHVCIGASLVVSELEEILHALLNSNISFSPSYNILAPNWTRNATFHGITEMPVKVTLRKEEIALAV